MIKTSAPGSLMLMGEHAILHGHPALVTAINKRLSVQVSSRDDKKILIHSALGNYEDDLIILKDDPRFRFALEALKHFQPHLTSGLDILIDSEIDSTKGLGSSAALVVSLVTALFRTTRQEAPSQKKLFLTARQIIRKVQGRGSGSDVAASIHGGIVSYDPRKEEVIPFKNPLIFCAIYAGYKTPTPQVIDFLEKASREDSEKYKALYEKIGSTTHRGIEALQAERISDFVQAFQENQSLMIDLGISDKILDMITKEVLTQPNVLGAKISGSGLGDCILALLEKRTPITCLSGEVLDISFDQEGVRYD